jgi:hypothetical protein
MKNEKYKNCYVGRDKALLFPALLVGIACNVPRHTASLLLHCPTTVRPVHIMQAYGYNVKCRVYNEF